MSGSCGCWKGVSRRVCYCRMPAGSGGWVRSTFIRKTQQPRKPLFCGNMQQTIIIKFTVSWSCFAKASWLDLALWTVIRESLKLSLVYKEWSVCWINTDLIINTLIMVFNLHDIGNYRITEHLSWKCPAQVIKSDSWLHRSTPKSDHVSEHCPNASGVLAARCRDPGSLSQCPTTFLVWNLLLTSSLSCPHHGFTLLPSVPAS